MVYKIAEKFKSLQGEGVYSGTPMAFIRFIGCSVGKTICQACDTDFDDTLPWRGGGEFTSEELWAWSYPYRHVCLTGGEPLDQDLEPLLRSWPQHLDMLHIETSGTRTIPDLPYDLSHQSCWICVSPKPGFREDVVLAADEIKVIVPGLGVINEKNRDHWTLHRLPHDVAQMSDSMERRILEVNNALKHWPTLGDALRWASAGKTVFLQPRNAKNEIDKTNLMYVLDVLKEYPQLRLSSQLHKILKVQ